MAHAFDYSRLTVEERLELIGDIWDSIVDGDADAIPVPPAHIAELERRLEDEKLHPEDSVSWEELKRKLGQSK